MMLWINVVILLSYVPSLVQGHGYLIDRDFIAKKDGFKFNLHSGYGVVRGKGFHSLGCWKDTWIRAIQPLEKRHELLMNGDYKLREDPLRKCAVAALDNKMKLFAIENGGQCLGDTTITSSYKKYGAADHCKDDGYGGPWSMQVYGFTGANLRRHGGYSKWSSWTKCVGTCGKGIQKRFRTCSHPSPAHGGRDCSRLGPGMETRPCESECLGTEDDELEDSSETHNSMDKHKTDKFNKSPHSTKASKKSDDTNDYLDDDDDDDDDPDNDDDDDDNSSNNSDDEPKKNNGGKNTNQADESDSASNPSYESTDKGKEVFKNSYGKPSDHLVQYQGIGKNPNAKIAKPTQMVGGGLGKTQSGSLVLKSTSDMIKSDGEMANDGPVMSQSKSANTVSEASTNIAFGNKAGNSELSSNSGLVNGGKFAKGNGDLSTTNSDISENGDTMKQSVSRFSQGTTDIQPGNTNVNNEQSDKSALGYDLSSLPKTSSGTSGVGGMMKQSTLSQGGKPKETAVQSAGVANGSTMVNHLSGISNTQTSDAGVKEPSTSDSELGDAEENDEDGNDEDLSGGKSTMANDISDTSKSETSSNVHNVKESSEDATDTKPGTTGENVDKKAGPSNEYDKSIMDNDSSDASDSETSDNGAHMKEVNQGAGKTQLDTMVKSDESSSSGAKNDLPTTQQMKAAQDLLRFRWLSLAKSGSLKPTPTKQSDNSSKPVVDVSLKDESEEDFEDKDMENNQSANADVAKGSTVENHLSDISNTPTSDSNSTKEANTAESELGDTEEDDEEDADDDEQKVNARKMNERKVNAEKVNAGEVNEQKVKAGKVNEQKVNAGEVNEQKVNAGEVNEQKVNAGEVNEQKLNAGEVNEQKVNGEKEDNGEVDEQTTDEWKQEERGRNVEKTENRVNDQTTEGKNQEGRNENGEDIQMNDNQAVDGGRTVEHERKVDEPKMNEDSAPGNVGDEAMNAPEMEKHAEPLNDHKGDESGMEETEGNEDEDVMHEKMSEENGAKRVKEECICPVLDLMGKPGPNTKLCPCLTEPSKKASPPEKPLNAQMTKEEYKTGMFHASGLPKVDTSSMTSSQPSSTSEGTTLPTTSSTPPAKKPLIAMSETKPSGENVPAPETSPDTSGAGQPASSLALDRTPNGNQQVVTSSQPATQSKPAIPPKAGVTTQATPTKATNKVLHIKNGRFKPLSKTLSTLGESLNKAHSKGELNEGSYTLDTDIHNLLSTIGKLKSQVDSLRNDQEQLGDNDAVWSKQSGTVSGSPSQSEATHGSNSQSSSSMAPTNQSLHSSEYAGQSQSNTDNESSKGHGDNTKTDSSHLLKLRIVGQTANKQQKNATILHLKLSDKIKAAKNKPVGKSLGQNPGVGNINTATTDSVSHDTTLAQPTNPVPSGQTTSIKAPQKPANIGNGEIPITSTEAKQNKNLANVDGISQSANAKLKRPQQTNLLSPANGAQQNVKTTAPSGGVKVSQSTNTASGATVKQPTNALDNGKQTLSPATTSQPKTSLQDASPTKPNPQTNTLPQQSVSTTQKAKPSPSKPTTQLTVPQTNTLPQESIATSQKLLPSATQTSSQGGSTTGQAKPPQSNTIVQQPLQESIVPHKTLANTPGSSTAPQNPLPSATKTSPQGGSTTGQAKPPQSNTIVQQRLQERIVPHTTLAKTPESSTTPQKPLPSKPITQTKPNAGASSLIQRAAQHKTKDFTAIESTLAKIVKTQQATPKSTVPACNINLGFVLDGSASVEGTRRGNFLKMINFVKDMIHAFVELSQQVHVGTLVYSTNSSVILSFGTKGTEKVIDQILDSVHYPGQGSLTGKAIKDAWNQMFSSVPRGRKSKLLLLTDGPSNDDVKMPSKWLRDNGVEMFIIGLGKGYDQGQLQDMASQPSDQHIMIKDYDDLRTSIQEARNKICGFNANQVLQIMTSARFSDSFKEINAFQRTFGRKQCILDVVFLLDGSRQVETNGEGNFQREISFVKKAAKYLPLSRNDVHIGVGVLGDSNVMVFPMNEHYIRNSIDYELDHIRYPASSDIQPQEIKYARQLMLMKGIRDVAPRVFVLVTDVSSIDSYRRAIDELRTDGSDVAIFGVGSEIYKQEVKVRSSVQGLVDQVVTLDSADESEAAKHFAINMCKISNSKRTEIPRLTWKASDKVLNQN
ncbi:partial [Paramuricea clavata]|uniref:Partial n=1 Tax=Paramuricea clavata TaxID=317549 RepID=A0A6S7H0P5_PARCT|nr:partial [Paramuricea clavata]